MINLNHFSFDVPSAPAKKRDYSYPIGLLNLNIYYQVLFTTNTEKDQRIAVTNE